MWQCLRCVRLVQCTDALTCGSESGQGYFTMNVTSDKTIKHRMFMSTTQRSSGKDVHWGSRALNRNSARLDRFLSYVVCRLQQAVRDTCLRLAGKVLECIGCYVYFGTGSKPGISHQRACDTDAYITPRAPSAFLCDAPAGLRGVALRSKAQQTRLHGSQKRLWQLLDLTSTTAAEHYCEE